MLDKQQTKRLIQVALLPSCIGIASHALSGLADETWKPFLEHILPAVSRSWLLLLVLLLCVVCCLLAILLWMRSYFDVRRDCDLLTERGFYRAKKTGDLYCGACAAVHRTTPLKRSLNGCMWECPFPDCNATYDRLASDAKPQDR